MKLRCIFSHRWGEWREVGHHLERKCSRCGETDAKCQTKRYSTRREIEARFMADAGLLVIGYLLDRERRKRGIDPRPVRWS